MGRRMDPITGEIYHMKFKPPPPEIVPRLVQRSDDTEEAVRTRLATYHANLNSVLSYYEDVLVQIDGSRSMPDVYADVKAALEKLIRERETDYLRQTA